MNDQPERRFALTINADELLKPDAVEPVEKACNTCHDEGWITLTGPDTVRAVCPFCNKDGHRVSIDTDLARQLSQPVEREGGETARLRRVINRIAAQVGHPPIAPGELGIESVAEAVERHAAYAREHEETLDSITPEKLQAFAASEAHHEEHHERERQLEAQLADAQREIERSHEIIVGQNEEIVKAKRERDEANARAEAAEKQAKEYRADSVSLVDKLESAQGDIEELTFCEECGEDDAKLEINGCYPPRYCHGCQQKLVVRASIAGGLAWF